MLINRSLSCRVVSLGSTNCKIYLLTAETVSKWEGEFLTTIFERNVGKMNHFILSCKTRILIAFGKIKTCLAECFLKIKCTFENTSWPLKRYPGGKEACETHFLDAPSQESYIAEDGCYLRIFWKCPNEK